MKCTECNDTIKPVVVSDIDGVLADYHETFACFAWKYWDMRSRPSWDGTGEFEDHLGLTTHQYREAKLAFRQGGNKRWSLPLMNPEQRSDLRQITEHAELWIATTRPWNRLDNIDPDTQWWMARQGIEFSGMLYGDDKYQQVVDRVGVDRVVLVMEDLREQCEIADDLGLRVVQISRQHNEHDQYKVRMSMDTALMQAKVSVGLWA